MSKRWSVLDPPRQPLSRSDYRRLQGVARRLAQTYPPDWLERRSSQLHIATILASLALTLLVGALWSPWWTYLVPAMCPLLLLCVLPRWLFGREAGRPRWAHPLAIVEDDDVALIATIVDAMDGPFNAAFARHCPASDGAKFFAIWQVLQCAGFEEPR